MAMIGITDGRKLLVPGALLFVVSALLISIVGFDPLVRRFVEFLTHYAFRIKTAVVAVTVAVLAAEVIVRGYRRSVVCRLLHPSKSALTDIYVFALHVTGFFVLLEAFFTLGATEWVPAVARRLVGANGLAHLDAPWTRYTLYFAIMSLIEYWMHRWAHSMRWWWQAHKYHHAATEMNMITTLRGHPIDSAAQTLVSAVPLALLGPGGAVPFALYSGARIVHSLLIHSDFGWGWGWLGRWVVVSPRFHQIHHSTTEEHWNKNYSGLLVFWDRVFGTRYEGTVEPTTYGVVDDELYNQQGFLQELFGCAGRVYRDLGAILAWPRTRPAVALSSTQSSAVPTGS